MKKLSAATTREAKPPRTFPTESEEHLIVSFGLEKKENSGST